MGEGSLRDQSSRKRGVHWDSRLILPAILLKQYCVSRVEGRDADELVRREERVGELFQSGLRLKKRGDAVGWRRKRLRETQKPNASSRLRRTHISIVVKGGWKVTSTRELDIPPPSSSIDFHVVQAMFEPTEPTLSTSSALPPSPPSAPAPISSPTPSGESPVSVFLPSNTAAPLGQSVVL